MKTVRIVRDIGLTHSPVYKVICDCGWYDKFYVQDVVKKAEAHIRRNHTTGLIHEARTNQTKEVK